LAFFKKPVQIEKAILTDRENYPKLWSHVESIANKIEARKPDNIIIGLQPTFYATSAEVQLVFKEENLKGQTLFLSLPLMKLFNNEELDAVVGHELGHFKAKDTNYSSKFAPVYANLGKSIDNLSNTISGASALAKLPAIFVLSAMYDTFATNIAAISREREFEADRVGCEASTKEGLVYSLAKVVTYSRLWNDTLLDNIKRLNNGRVTTNLSEVFRESSLYNIGKKDIDDIIDEVLPSIVQHPTDSHPPMTERYKNIDFDESQITREKIIAQGDASTIYIDNAEKLEEELTMMEHQYLAALGVVNIPEEANDDGLANVIYSMAAAMIGADGKLEIDEVQVAEDMGIKILPDFDRVEFRRFIDNLEEIPKLERVAEACKDFSDENKQIIYNYLEKIAYADDDLADDEKKILDNLKEIWELSKDE
jgi:Zn-dependent protease with chaperone function